MSTITNSVDNKLTNPQIINSILDSNLNTMIGILPSSNAVNYLQISNAPTNAGPSITPIGTDSNISLYLYSKNGVISIADITSTSSGRLELSNVDRTFGVGFMAPATLTADTSWQLPAADGTRLSNLQTDGSSVLSFGAGPQAWALINGSSGGIVIGENVASCVANGGGNYTITFTNAFSTANYTAFCIECGSSNGGLIPSTRELLTTGLQAQFVLPGTGGTNVDQFALICFGILA